jgi:hypothetical protein
MKRPPRSPADSATPPLLGLFLAATLAIVAAVAAIGRSDSDWAVAGAMALLLGTLAFVVGGILRRLGDDEPTAPEDRPLHR